MNALIPLQGQTPDIVGSLDRGFSAGRRAGLANLYRENGAGIASGDQNALAALAQYDPRAALDVQSTQQGMQAQRELMGQRRAASGRAAETHAASENARAKYQQIERAVGLMNQAQTPDQWDQIARMSDPSLVGQFGNKQALLGRLLPLKEQLAMQIQAEQGPTPLSGVGKVQADINSGILPADTPLSRPTTVVENNLGGGSSELYKELDKGTAKMFQGLLSGGMTVSSRLGQIDQLEQALNSAPSGAEAAIKFAAGNFGIETEGLTDLQVAQSIINRMVPAQREPGSGPMSDRDLEIFKQSLPRLINTPEGNQKIVSTMRGLLEYELKQSDIAQRVASRQIGPAVALQELRQLENPLSTGPNSAKSPVEPFDPQTPDFSQMSDAELEAYIERAGQ
ncbi:MAG: hypothetical protein ABJ360_22550 [Roseobacter sp.]